MYCFRANCKSCKWLCYRKLAVDAAAATIPHTTKSGHYRFDIRGVVNLRKH